MQTYSPTSAMTPCVSGGEYVRRDEAENKIAALQQRIKELEKMVKDFLAEMVNDFLAEMDKDDTELEILHDKIDKLEAEIAEWKRVASEQAALHDEDCRRLESEVASLKAELTKYKAFWDDARLTDKMNWERNDWPKHDLYVASRWRTKCDSIKNM